MRILFADDDPDTRALVIRALSHEFPDAEALEAWDLASLNAALAGDPIDILISDHDLRSINGLEVLARTRDAHPRCAAVMFTGTGNEDLAVEAMKAGFDDYIVKNPGQMKRLASSARIAFDRSAEHHMLEENRQLLREELYHRLHNNLQIIVSLMALTLRGISDPDAHAQVRELIRRIQSLSLLQEQFYRAADLRRIDIGEFIATLAHDLDGSHPGAALHTDIASILVAVDQAVPLGLIANELIMCGLAPPGGTSPRELNVSLAEDKGDIVLSVETCHGNAGKTVQPGLGMDLIERLASQVEAKVRRARSGDSTLTTVTFPA